MHLYSRSALFPLPFPSPFLQVRALFYGLLMGYGTDQDGSRDTILACLLYACYQTLSGKGMTGMFVDGVSAGDHVFVSLGELEPQPKDEKLRRILSFSRF